jgi:hypothetical protein
MKVTRILTVLVLSVLTLSSAYAADSLDAQLHSMVTDKVQQDHAADVKAGKVGHRSSHTNTSSGSTAAAATSSSTSATHPNQVQDLKRKKRKKTPPPETHPGHHRF